jgi:hypothetical protein
MLGGMAFQAWKTGFLIILKAQLFQVVGDARLERATFGSGDQRSIHLS